MKIEIVNSDVMINTRIAKRIIELVKRKPNAVLGLATGSSPLGIYKQIILSYQQGHVSFKDVKTFNLDEYIGLENQKDSYRHFMDLNLFDHIDIQRENIHFPDPQDPDAYDIVLEDNPIDLQLLGIGADGHIGFNEPGTPFSSLTHIATLAEKTRKDNARFFLSLSEVPSKAVTMGLSTIFKAKEIVLVATGPNKAEAIKEMMNRESENCPASILTNHQNVTVYLDEEAGKEIE